MRFHLKYSAVHLINSGESLWPMPTSLNLQSIGANIILALWPFETYESEGNSEGSAPTAALYRESIAPVELSSVISNPQSHLSTTFWFRSSTLGLKAGSLHSAWLMTISSIESSSDSGRAATVRVTDMSRSFCIEILISQTW